MEKYLDPENIDEILEKIKNAETHGDLQDILANTYPTWLTTIFDRYSSDYSYLQTNWETMCGTMNTTPKKIVGVECIAFDENHKLVNTFCEVMTKFGYCIRRNNEYVYCDSCKSAIPCLQLYNMMKEKNMPVPAVWRNKCKGC